MATLLARPSPAELQREVLTDDDRRPKPHFSFRPLHKTFGAEVLDADFSQITPELVGEIKAGLAKVRLRSSIVHPAHIGSSACWSFARLVWMMRGTSRCPGSLATWMILSHSWLV